MYGIGLSCLAILVLFNIYFFNYRAYRASSILLSVSRPSLTMEQALDLFDKSITSFRPLANYPRLIMFTSLVENWDTFTESQALLAFTAGEMEALEAIEAEPENWRLNVALAELYLTAGSNDASRLDRARLYLDKAKLLAPKRPEVLRLATKLSPNDEN